MVRALGVHAVDPGSNPVLTSGLDLFLRVPDSTQVLNHVSFKLIKVGCL